MTLVNLARQAEDFCVEHFARITTPTHYVAGFRTRLGRELALDRQRDGIYCWSELVIDLYRLEQLPEWVSDRRHLLGQRLFNLLADFMPSSPAALSA